jgi:hypothetical protein
VQCATHSNTLAIGLCVACGIGVCGSCSTRLQGRNFCVACLSSRAESAGSEAAVVSAPGLQLLVLASALVSALVLVAALSSMGFALYMMG